MVFRPTAEQARIIAKSTGHALVDATAGSGKTTTCAHHVAQALESGLAPGQILVLTFSNPAQAVFAERLKTALGGDVPPEIDLKTFHALGLAVTKELERLGYLEEYEFLPGDHKVIPHVLEAIDQVDGTLARDDADLNKDNYYVEQLLGLFQRLKATLELDDPFFEGTSDREISDALGIPYTHLALFRAYELVRRRRQFRGFPDLIYDALKVLTPDCEQVARYGWRYRLIIVDEFHDVNEAQLRLLKVFTGPQTRILAVGDADQCIHAWQGARPEFMRSRFDAEFRGAERLPLGETFRFGPALAHAVNNLMAGSHEWAHKQCVSRLPLRTLIDVQGYDNDHAPAVVETLQRWVASAGQLPDCAVLVREQSQTISIENALIEAGIPYWPTDIFPYTERLEILALRGLLHLALGNLHTVSNLTTRAAIVRAMMSVPSLGLDQERLELAGREVADNPDLLATFSSFQIQAVTHDDTRPGHLTATLERVKATQAFLTEHATRLTAAQLLEGAVQRLDLHAEARRIHLRSEQAKSMQNSIAAFIESAKRTGSSAEGFLRELEDRDKARLRHRHRAVVLTTCDRAKGKEWEHVIIPGIDRTTFPLVVAGNGQDYAEERRLFYVAITRARSRLTLIARRLPGEGSGAGPSSPFVRELDVQRAMSLGQADLKRIPDAPAPDRERPAKQAPVDPAGTVLDVPFEEKDQAKSLGAKWNATTRKWYVPAGVDVAPFERWLRQRG